MQRSLVIAAALSGLLSLSGADWLTDGGNPQRTAWQKDEKILSVGTRQEHDAALEAPPG